MAFGRSAATLRLSEPLLPQRALPARRDRAARLPGEPDADPEAGRLRQGHVLAADPAGAERERRERGLQPEPAGDQGDPVHGPEGEGPLPDRPGPVPAAADPGEEQRHLRLEGRRLVAVVDAAHLALADRAAARLLALPHEPGAG